MEYEVKKYFFGKPIPQVVQVSFELAYPDWCELQASKLWCRLVEGGSLSQKGQEQQLLQAAEAVSELGLTVPPCT